MATATQEEEPCDWLKLPWEGDYYGNNIIYFDQYSGDLVRADIHEQKPFAKYLLESFSAVHYGTFWGLPTRLLYVLVNLALVGLVVTGFVLWWGKTYGRRKAQRQTQARAHTPKTGG